MREDLSRLSDNELESSLLALAADDRRHLVAVLRHLAELDRRDLAAKRGFPSLFAYCVRKLRYSEGEAYRRIHAARAAVKFPVLYRALGRGILSLTSVSMLAPHLTRENYRRLLRGAANRSTRDVEVLTASLSPRRQPPDRVRRLSPGLEEPAAPARPSGCGMEGPDLFAAPDPAEAERAAEALRQSEPGVLFPGIADEAAAVRAPAPPRIEFVFAAEEALLQEVERARQLLRHKYPSGRLADIFGEALRVLLERIDPERRLRRKAQRGRPRAPGKTALGAAAIPAGRASCLRIPQGIKDIVWLRDGGRCAFTEPGGRRCESRDALEYDHIRPLSLGGRSDDPANVRLLCRAHNALEARRILGDDVIDAAIAGRRRVAARPNGESDR